MLVLELVTCYDIDFCFGIERVLSRSGGEIKGWKKLAKVDLTGKNQLVVLDWLEETFDFRADELLR